MFQDVCVCVYIMKYELKTFKTANCKSISEQFSLNSMRHNVMFGKITFKCIFAYDYGCILIQFLLLKD